MLFYPVLLIQTAITRARALRADDSRERGASAIEWAIIAAITVVAAIAIGAIVYRIVDQNSTKLQNCQAANAQPGGTC